MLFGERSGRRREHSLGEAFGQGGGETVCFYAEPSGRRREGPVSEFGAAGSGRRRDPAAISRTFREEEEEGP